MSRRVRRGLLLAPLLVLATDQVLQHTVLADGMVGTLVVAPFDPPLFSATQREHLARLRDEVGAGRLVPELAVFDPELGWAPRAPSSGRWASYDEHGARRSRVPIAAERAPGRRRVVAIGCSFTHGDEVAGEECWTALLSDEREDLEVANLGMGGYGLDQALLRLRRDGLALAPDEVWLGWMPRATLRCSTSFPPLQNHWTPLVLFKPRFELEGERLVARPNPATDAAMLVALLGDQRRCLAALGDSDPWIARLPAAFAPRGSSWMHHSSLARLALTMLERRGHHPRGWLADPQGGTSRLVSAIAEAAAEEARTAGARFRVLLLPSQPELVEARSGAGYWRATASALAERGIEILDVGPALLAAGADTEASFWMEGGHYSPAAHRVVADAIGREVDRAGR